MNTTNKKAKENKLTNKHTNFKTNQKKQTNNADKQHCS